MTHLRVFERQGPIKFSRKACKGGSELKSERLTDTPNLVTCPRCQTTMCTNSNEPGQVGSFYGPKESWPTKGGGP